MSTKDLKEEEKWKEETTMKRKEGKRDYREKNAYWIRLKKEIKLREGNVLRMKRIEGVLERDDG